MSHVNGDVQIPKVWLDLLNPNHGPCRGSLFSGMHLAKSANATPSRRFLRAGCTRWSGATGREVAEVWKHWARRSRIGFFGRDSLSPLACPPGEQPLEPQTVRQVAEVRRTSMCWPAGWLHCPPIFSAARTQTHVATTVRRPGKCCIDAWPMRDRTERVCYAARPAALIRSSNPPGCQWRTRRSQYNDRLPKRARDSRCVRARRCTRGTSETAVL
jgi:hypothetical protein